MILSLSRDGGVNPRDSDRDPLPRAVAEAPNGETTTQVSGRREAPVGKTAAAVVIPAFSVSGGKIDETIGADVPTVE